MYSDLMSGYKKILWFKSCFTKTYRKLEKTAEAIKILWVLFFGYLQSF